MPLIRIARSTSVKTQGAGPSQIQRAPSGLQQLLPSMGIGTARQAKMDVEFLISHVAALTHRKCHLGAAIPPEIVSLDPLRPHLEWIALDTEASVMGSLIALNAHLMFYEGLGRASRASSEIRRYREEAQRDL